MCGVVGFRPTTGSLTLRGVVAPAWTLDGYGLFGRDVQAITKAIAEVGWKTRTRKDDRPVTVGVVTDDSMGPVRPEVEAVYRRALESWKSSDLELRPISLTELELAAPAAALIAYVEVAVQHERWIRQQWKSYGSESRQLVCLGNLFSGTDYVLAQRARLALRRRFAKLTADVDAVITPTLPLTAPRLGGKPSVSGENDKPALFEIIRFTALANMIGAPAISVPVGLSEDGLPVAAQVIAQPWDDELTLRVAESIEASSGFVARPPCFVDVGAAA
jgi:Asp-tRNA(Asn)/Glu-tRNA(Gln) amidotransferase A subunit family amidase